MALIVPFAQTKVFEVEYQIYTFCVFHQHPVNRWTHHLGFVASLMAFYVLAAELPYGDELTLAALMAAHVIMSVKYRFYAMSVFVVTAHIVIWATAHVAMAPLMTTDGSLLQHPVFHILFWPTAQFVTHAIERRFPPPVSRAAGWKPASEFFREADSASWANVVIFAPFHALVELISIYRNLFVSLVLLARWGGYRTLWLDRTMAWVERECAAEQPVTDYSDFRDAFADVERGVP